jgi:hypothetical protein
MGASYVLAEGWAVIEDYERLDGMVRAWPEVMAFIERCVVSAFEESPELQELRAQLEEAREKALRTPAKQRATVREVGRNEEALSLALKTLAGFEDPPPDWLLEGIRRWIEVFLPGRITLRVYPFEQGPAFQLICNLKRDSFVDADLGNLLFAYGTRPNVKLSVFGLVTSVPAKAGHEFNPLAEFENDSRRPLKSMTMGRRMSPRRMSYAGSSAGSGECSAPWKAWRHSVAFRSTRT